MNNKKYIDLHIHSKASDGKLSVLEIIHKAQKSGLTAIAITDHNTIGGIKEYLSSKKKVDGIEIIPGVEVSAIYKGTLIHILVYAYSQDGKFSSMIENLKKRNLRHYIDYKRSIVKEIYYEYIDAISLLQLVKEDGGVSVLAHPKRVCSNYKGLTKIILDLASHGLDGIESFHKENSLIEQKKFDWFAIRHDLISTGGSDFHGITDDFGCNKHKPKIPYRYLEKLKEKARTVK